MDTAEPQNGKGTFTVQVQFTRNCTWQGTVSWLDQKKTQRFRSALELISLMNSALSGRPGSAPPEWDAAWEENGEKEDIHEA